MLPSFSLGLYQLECVAGWFVGLLRKRRMNEQETRRWTVVNSAELYEVGGWGKGYFSVNDAGNVCVHPEKDPQQKIDLKQLVDQLQARQIELPS